MPAPPSHRITPAQVLALVIIWGAVAYGSTTTKGPTQVARAENAQLIACR